MPSPRINGCTQGERGGAGGLWKGQRLIRPRGHPSSPVWPRSRKGCNNVLLESGTFEMSGEGHIMARPSGDLAGSCGSGSPRGLGLGLALTLTMSHGPFSLSLAPLGRCTADDPGQKAEAERQKICLNRASSVRALMRSRRSTSVAFDPPACGSAVHLHPELLH